MHSELSHEALATVVRPPDGSRGPLENHHPGRVLVIGPDDQTRQAVEVLITIEGCEVRTALDGGAALAVIARWTPDLVLLDVDAPDPTRETFVEAFEQRPAPRAPLVLFSRGPLTTAELAELRAASWLPKPFALRELYGLLELFAPCA